jgi:predicted AAA+ superfamily ATPase
LAKQFISSYHEPVYYFDLEDPADLAKLDNPKLTLEPLNGLIVIDEVQRRPELFPYLRVLVDKKPVKLLLLGSASPDLLKQSSDWWFGF